MELVVDGCVDKAKTVCLALLHLEDLVSAPTICVDHGSIDQDVL